MYLIFLSFDKQNMSFCLKNNLDHPYACSCEICGKCNKNDSLNSSNYSNVNDPLNTLNITNTISNYNSNVVQNGAYYCVGITSAASTNPKNGIDYQACKTGSDVKQSGHVIRSKGYQNFEDCAKVCTFKPQ